MEADHQREYQRPVNMPDARDGFWKHESFHNLTLQIPQLAGLQEYLLSDCLSFAGRDHVHSAYSSYKSHHYDVLFYALIRLLRPQRCLELGILEGFSLLATASALRDNGTGHVTAYDLFEDYPFRHASFEEVRLRCQKARLDRYITLCKGSETDAFGNHSEVDILHIDLSNDGDVVRELFSMWANKVTLAILLEGGSEERDQIHWMQRYARPSIANAVDHLRAEYADWLFVVLNPFPSMTLAFRR
jgi:hypothetical protein